jgi:hypothetical protein
MGSTKTGGPKFESLFVSLKLALLSSSVEDNFPPLSSAQSSVKLACLVAADSFGRTN